MESIDKKKLLLVDDDEAFCAILSRVLTRSGFEVAIAYNIEQALSMNQSISADFAIVDLKIGDESGLSLIADILKQKSDVRIIILTGYASISTAVEAIKLGAVQYLTKPAAAKDIIQALLSDTEGNSDVELPEDPMSVKRLEWEYLQKVLMQHQGNISATAKALGMHRRTLQRKLQKHPVRR